MRRPWSVSRRPAKAWYVEITGSPGGLSGSIASGSVTPALTSALRTRSASSPAALVEETQVSTCGAVRHSTPCGSFGQGFLRSLEQGLVDPLAAPPARTSLDYLLSLRPGAARRPERAVRAVLPGGRREPLVEDLA